MIVGVGYADGVPRLLSGKGQVFAQGKHCAIRGRVSMDMLHADATEIDVAVGDWVEIMGAHICLDDIANQAQTIAYEILTGLGKRLPRVYLNGSDTNADMG
jgi:alanine racemase